ncbi:protocadherin-9 isoform X1 [Labeo rohita]|uniref:Protocadherin-9 isoform X1 n=1 Tax=Labeo rohita TaxID=84645 RepID=A0A498MQK7_LABRO|nr:protocadherin-9 isoform X1 [Labeo rohita]
MPDGSQESCSDSGLGDHEPVGSGPLLSHPLPLVQAQDDFYEQASPDKRTEADGNSDPNSDYRMELNAREDVTAAGLINVRFGGNPELKRAIK